MDNQIREKLLNLAKAFKSKNENLSSEDAVICALEELDDGWGIFVDPTRENTTTLFDQCN